MLLTIAIGKERNALLDGYKDIVNGFKAKRAVIAVFSAVYANNEFSPGLFLKVRENFSLKNKIMSKLAALFFIGKLVGIIAKNRVRHCFIYNDKSWFNLLLLPVLQMLKVKYSVWIHDPDLHSGEILRVRIVSFLVSRWYQKAEKVFVAYTRGCDAVTRKFKIGPEKVICLKFPALKDLQFEELRAAEQNGGQAVVDVLFFGCLTEYKGLDILLDAAELLEKSHHCQFKFLIVGTGRDSQYVKRRVAQLNNVRFINQYVDNKQLAAYICAARTVVFPYKDATATQTVQICNYYHKPVIVSAVGCFPEYVDDGINGLVIKDIDHRKLAGSIRKLLTEADGYGQLKARIDDFYNGNFRFDRFINRLTEELGVDPEGAGGL